MKKSMLILILTALLSACSESENTSEKAEIFTFQTTQITSVTTTKIAEITTVSAEITTFAHQSETTTQTTAVINQQKEKIPEEPQVSERQEVTETAEAYDENHDDFSELIIENTTEKSDVPVQTDPSQIPEITSTTATEPKEYEKESSAVECGLSDYEKALEIYNFMTSSGSGTCVQYAYQTYEMCLEYGLECYFAWTENQLYGHVANVVKIDGVWYVLDTQAVCFLPENMCGFTEIVDENENHIADADIISGAILKKWTAKGERWYNNKKRRETHGKHQVYRGI